MPRKRRADDEDGDEEDEYNDTPARAQTQRATQHRRSATPESENEYHPGGHLQTSVSMNVMVKKLVRLALASEYSRQPIRRTDISAKVLGDGGARHFKLVFLDAQKTLKEVFGMQMVEQPSKDKVTISQRRAAQRVEKSSTSKSWTVISTLPPAYRTPEILPPSRAPNSSTESSYIAIYTFIISLIMLSGGSLSEDRLNRHLRRVNAENHTPLDRTDKLLARLCKEGYLVKVRDTDAGEETIEYFVGQRGKIEVGVSGVSGMAREVFGIAQGSEEDSEQFEKRLKRSLRYKENTVAEAENAEAEAPQRRGRRGDDESD
ncbi:hypothetical protein MGYG_00984 [Nannizzia gypsea CBS 118893]|uniref:MAGE domain-containing protein n=1 Tax=Arthroderma gypseum (strain ATCC MYA-4604 / CBS 118893) TaxID=535722 RepID=E5R3D3_ARTGP|nr:hypothetical protein MGYG_00984 [Nannizzia gypsea CBS 118893]EFQ97948.1 hypothetical protein MGYG_00984 [Nannizzia gypsea CBS 118893]